MKIILLLTMISFTFQNHFNIFEKEEYIRTFIQSGSQMDRFFTASEFWDWFDSLRSDLENRNYVSGRIPIGKTYLGNTMYGYYIGEDVKNIELELETKNMIFINSLHHSREPVSLQMSMYMTIELLKVLRTKKHHRLHELFRDTIVFILPIVNLDSYEFINNNWRKDEDNNILMIRKNRNIDSSCDIYSGGVDLNRNYDFKFALDETGSSSNPCQEDYRGESPFSEPETNNIKKFIDNNTNVISGINIHTYGNVWIYPFNYVKDGENEELKESNQNFYEYFKEFESDIKKFDHFIVFGNAAMTLDYPSNGEAGDWYIGAKNILNLDVELGNKDENSHKFYPPKNIIYDIVSYNWLTFEKFFISHNIDLNLKKLTIYEPLNIYTFQIQNKGIGWLRNYNAKIVPVYEEGYYANSFKLYYGMKKLLEDEIDLIPVVDESIGGTLKGRHILEFEIEFFDKNDFINFRGLELSIKRSHQNVREYPHQKFTFMIKNTEAVIGQ